MAAVYRRVPSMALNHSNIGKDSRGKHMLNYPLSLVGGQLRERPGSGNPSGCFPRSSRLSQTGEHPLEARTWSCYSFCAPCGPWSRPLRTTRGPPGHFSKFKASSWNARNTQGGGIIRARATKLWCGFSCLHVPYRSFLVNRAFLQTAMWLVFPHYLLLLIE